MNRFSRIMRYEPSMKHGVIVGLVVMGLAYVGVEATEEEVSKVGDALNTVFIAIPLIQGVVQGWLTRRKVVPVKKLNDAGVAAPDPR